MFSIAPLPRNQLIKKMSEIVTGLVGTKVHMNDIYFKGNQRKKRGEAKNTMHFSQIEATF